MHNSMQAGAKFDKKQKWMTNQTLIWVLTDLPAQLKKKKQTFGWKT